MARSGLIKQKHDAGSIVVSDGTPTTPLSHEVLYDQADVSVQDLRNGGRGSSVYQSRAKVHSVRKGERVFAVITWSFMLDEWTEASEGTLLDMVLGTAGTPYAARVTTGRIKGDVVMLDVTWNMAGIAYGDAADHQLIFRDCDVHVTQAGEGEPNAVTIEAVCYGQITGDLDFNIAA